MQHLLLMKHTCGKSLPHPQVCILCAEAEAEAPRETDYAPVGDLGRGQLFSRTFESVVCFDCSISFMFLTCGLQISKKHHKGALGNLGRSGGQKLGVTSW